MEAVKTVLFLIVAACLAASGLLVVVGGADGHYKSDGLMRINHPPPSTWEWLTTSEKRKQWEHGVVASTEVGPRLLDVGSRIREMVEVDGVTKERLWEVTAYTHGKLITMRTSDDKYDMELTFKVGALHTGRKTRLDYMIDAQYHETFDKLIEPILGAQLRRRVRDDLEALKHLLETTRTD